MDSPHALDAVVTTAAVALMAATADTSAQISQQVLAELVRCFDVDVSFLRYNDPAVRASRLVAEWPPRPVTSESDPLAVVYFAGADPVFAQCEHATQPAVFRPYAATEQYQRLVESGTGVLASSMAAVPLMSGKITTGTLGFVKFGDRAWQREELNVLQAIAALFAQVQARIAAERRLHYLAHHDELTGLCNRRGLLNHLRARLGHREPVSLLYLDLDRLKDVNDGLGHTAGDDVIRATAHRLRTAVGEQDFLARLGGDEFVASLLIPMPVSDIAELADRIHLSLAQPLSVAGRIMGIEASIGVLTTDGRDSRSPEQLLRDADTAMYTAKNISRGMIRPATHDRRLMSVDDQASPHETSPRSLIDQAIGILRSRTGNASIEAYHQLEHISHTTNTDLAQTAYHVVEDAARLARHADTVPMDPWPPADSRIADSKATDRRGY